MSADEIHELHEHAEQAHAHRGMIPVSFTMAVIAVLVAGVSVLAQRGQTEEILLQTKVTDQWAYYQSKNIRKAQTELFSDLIKISEFRDREGQQKLEKKYEEAVAKLTDQQTEIEKQTREHENDLVKVQHHVNRLEVAEALLEVALVITSITLLTQRKLYWMIGSSFALIGVGCVVYAMLTT